MALDMNGSLASSSSAKYAADWLISIQNPSVGGWGFYEGDKECHLLSTGYVIRILTKVTASDNNKRESSIESGRQFIMKCLNNETGGFGPKVGEKPTNVHTALAILALLSTGTSVLAPEIVRARKWVLENIDIPSGEQDYYVAPRQGTHGPGRRIDHTNFNDGIVLHALMKSMSNPKQDLLDPAIKKFIGKVIRGQDQAKVGDPSGYWEDPFKPEVKPIYTIMDACFGLRYFIDSLFRI
jgi:hypothetical protein